MIEVIFKLRAIIFLVAAECSRNHFNSEKQKTELFKPHFLQNSPLLPATFKMLETFLEDIL
jgi:hypothetical protein